MADLGFDLVNETVLNTTQVRCSPTRRFGLDVGGIMRTDRHVEGIIEMMLDATIGCVRIHGRKRVHYEAPPAERLDREMDAFLAWFNAPPSGDEVLQAAVAHHDSPRSISSRMATAAYEGRHRHGAGLAKEQPHRF